MDNLNNALKRIKKKKESLKEGQARFDKLLSAKVDYILEWNYFLILLIYYLLSFLIWKKSSFRDPSST